MNLITRHNTISEVNKIIVKLERRLFHCLCQLDISNQLWIFLRHVINNCIDKSIFPDEWKIARMCPIPKTKNPTELNEYRPISVLSVLSKIFHSYSVTQFDWNQWCVQNESVRISKRTLKYLIANEIKGYPPSNEVTLSVFADYNKAFNYKILLRKLQALNFANSSLLLIIAYYYWFIKRRLLFIAMLI